MIGGSKREKKKEEEILKGEAEEEPKPRERDIYITNKTL